jgi:class 3 adenylate cyclase
MPGEPASNGTAPPIVRRLSTILCADVAGYSQMMGANEERTVRVFRGHREVFESLVKLHRGRIFNTAGDALLVEFNSAVEAVRCATEIQAALSTRNEQLAPEEKMLFRMGINLGDVIVQGDDLLGDGVNVAARIQTATEPGGICISGSVYDQIQNKLSLDFKLLGEQVYKNIARPVRTYTINEGAAVTAPARRSSKIPAAIAAAGLIIAGAGYWGYQQYDAQRAERVRVESQMAAQLAAQKQATEQAQRAAEDAKRDAQVQAQKQAAEEALRRAQDERNRVEQDRKQLENEKRAAEATKKQAEASQRAVPVAPVAPKPTAQYDGTYDGELCNFSPGNVKASCWKVALSVRNGMIEGNWLGPLQQPSKASGTVTAGGGIDMKLAGWTRQGGNPIEASLVGRVSGDAITASGQWGNGGTVGGNWKRSSGAATPAPKRTAQYDGTYAGRLCNNPRDDAKRSCWPADLVIRTGIAESSWLSRTKNTSGARGTVAADGALELKLNGWTREGNPIDGSIAGRVAGDAITASGRWADGGTIAGEWKRAK